MRAGADEFSAKTCEDSIYIADDRCKDEDVMATAISVLLIMKSVHVRKRACLRMLVVRIKTSFDARTNRRR